jgi:hypothetical protein
MSVSIYALSCAVQHQRDFVVLGSASVEDDLNHTQALRYIRWFIRHVMA